MINSLEYLSEIKKNCRNIAIIILSFILISSIYTTFFMKQDYEATVKVFPLQNSFCMWEWLPSALAWEILMTKPNVQAQSWIADTAMTISEAGYWVQH